MQRFKLLKFWVINFFSTDRVAHKWLKSGDAVMSITLPKTEIDPEEMTFNVKAHGFDLYFHDSGDRKKKVTEYTLPDGTKRIRIEVPYDGWGKRLA